MRPLTWEDVDAAVQAALNTYGSVRERGEAAGRVLAQRGIEMEGNRTPTPLVTHDDYKRALVLIGVHRHVGRDEYNAAEDLRRNLLIAFHRLAFGMAPLTCGQCTDEEGTMRALNCDEAGNPKGPIAPDSRESAQRQAFYELIDQVRVVEAEEANSLLSAGWTLMGINTTDHAEQAHPTFILGWQRQ